MELIVHPPFFGTIRTLNSRVHRCGEVFRLTTILCDHRQVQRQVRQYDAVPRSPAILYSSRDIQLLVHRDGGACHSATILWNHPHAQQPVHRSVKFSV
jgi:hypothetical protein